MDKVEIVEVSPRDGLQNEAVHLATPDKAELVERALAAGVRRVEATSFVSPAAVPQLADAEDLLARLPRPPDVRYIGLVVNERGLERALAAGVHEINVVVVCSDTLGQRNQRATTDEAVRTARRLVERARAHGVGTGVTLAAAFGCPFEGEVPSARVADVAARVAEAAPGEIALADTIGCAVPTDVRERVRAVRAASPGIGLRVHLHNTRNTGLANVAAAVEEGVGAIDASIGGVGGCPFSPNATGNVPTEDVVWMLHRMGVDTGLDVDALVSAASWLEGRLGHAVPGMLAKAGPFPR